MKLKILPKRDRSKVDEALFTGEKVVTEADLSVTPEQVDAEVDLATIETVLDEIVSGERAFDSKHLIDAELAPIVHANIPLTREQAARPGIWHWLAVVWYPDFVRHRWPWTATVRTTNSMREKFLGAGSDIYSNAFGRLWWMAELSYDAPAEDPYHVTREALKVQMLANRLFDPMFARYPPAVIAFAQELMGESTETVRYANIRFNQALSTIQLESRTKDDLRAIVRNVVEAVKEDFDV
jgi:hypothetical protein